MQIGDFFRNFAALILRIARVCTLRTCTKGSNPQNTETLNIINNNDMKLLKILLLVMMAASVALGAEAKDGKKKKAEPQITTIYVFGVAQDMGDSIVYITSIAPVNGATLLPHDLLQHQQYYSEQMKNYVAQQYEVAHPTVGFFYARNQKKIAKKLARVQEKMAKNAFKHLTFVTIKPEEFHFKVPVLVNADEE